MNQVEATESHQQNGSDRRCSQPYPSFILPVDGPIPPDLDQSLTALALLAQAGDLAARDTLYWTFAPSIQRLARRFSGAGWGAGTVWTGDDLIQEGYLLFLDLIASWPGGDSFAAYALGRLPWRLRNVVRHLNGPRPARVTSAIIDHLTDESAAAAEAVILLEEVANALPTPDGDILLWRIRDRETAHTIALRLRIDRRTVTRSWQRTLVTLRETLIDPQDGHPIII